MALRRVDSELVRRKLADSRMQAQALIAAGRVWADGLLVEKSAKQIDSGASLRVEGAPNAEDDYVSRGAHKLIGALDTLGAAGPDLAGIRCVDLGASTGGFTEVLLRRGAASVVAIDVGYGQLAWKLRQDPRVEVRERTNARYLKAGDIDPEPDLFVGDLSFISLELIIPALCAAGANASQLLMVKPQFEVGKGKLGAGGVVRNLPDRIDAVAKIAHCAEGHGLGIRQVAASPLPGPSGNVEYFLWMTPNRQLKTWLTGKELDLAIREAVETGPLGAATVNAVDTKI